MDQGDRDLSRDRLFELLSNERRRRVLGELIRRDAPVGVTTLAEELAAVENDVPVDAVTAQGRKRVYVSLYQIHLPALADAGLIEYDTEAGTVALADDTVPLDQYLGHEADDRPWYYYYTALAAASLPLVVGVVTGFLALSRGVLGVGISLAFLAVAVTHALSRHGGLPVERPRLLES